MFISVKNSKSDSSWSNPILLTGDSISVQTKDEYILPKYTNSEEYALDVRFTGTLRNLFNMLGSSKYIFTHVEDVTKGLPPLGIKFDGCTEVVRNIYIYKVIGEASGLGYFVETYDTTSITSDKEYPVSGKNIVIYEVDDPYKSGKLNSYKLKYNSTDKYIIDHTLKGDPQWNSGPKFLVDNKPVCTGVWNEENILTSICTKREYKDDIKLIDLFRLYSLDTSSHVGHNLAFDKTDDRGIQTIDNSLLYLLE